MADPAGPDLPWPDVHDVLIHYLTDNLDDTTVDTSTPKHIGGPAVRVLRVGGRDDGLTDFPRVEIAAYDRSFDDARQLGEQIRQLILDLPGKRVLVPGGPTRGVLVDSAKTDTPPEPIPYDDPQTERAVAYYRLAFRRPSRPRP